jgi:ATP-dependent exoDNAse (exonuclease V) alpha subunit
VKANSTRPRATGCARHGDLGEDVRVKVERGGRNFAAGDRVMFLQNERGLGVKNGTLGTVEQVSDASMTVRPMMGAVYRVRPEGL